MKFTTPAAIELITLDALELDIDKDRFADLQDETEPMHMLEGEFLYCGLLIDARLILNTEQLNSFFADTACFRIRRIVDRTCYLSREPERKMPYRFRSVAQFVTTEDMDTEDECEVFWLL